MQNIDTLILPKELSALQSITRHIHPGVTEILAYDTVWLNPEYLLSLLQLPETVQNIKFINPQGEFIIMTRNELFGCVHLSQHNYKTAEFYFVCDLEKKPDNINSIINLAQIHRLNNKYQEALNLLHHILSDSHNLAFSQALLELILIYIHLKSPNDVLKYLHQLRCEDPKYFESNAIPVLPSLLLMILYPQALPKKSNFIANEELCTICFEDFATPDLGEKVVLADSKESSRSYGANFFSKLGLKKKAENYCIPPHAYHSFCLFKSYIVGNRTDPVTRGEICAVFRV